MINLVIFTVTVSGGVVIALATMYLLQARKIEGDTILPTTLHLHYDYWRDKLRKVLRE